MSTLEAKEIKTKRGRRKQAAEEQPYRKKLIRRRKPNRSIAGDIFLYLFLVFVAFIMAFPIIYAVSNALKKAYNLDYTLDTYTEHALEKSSSSRAIAYVGLKWPDGKMTWGAGLDPDIIKASIDALVTAVNNR